MSLSLFVVLALEVELNTNDLNLTAKELGYKIEYTKNIELKTHTGFLPVKLENQKSGAEFYSYPVSELNDVFKSKLPKEYSNGIVYQMSFGGNPIEAKTAFTSAILITTKYNGVAIDDQSGTLLTTEMLSQALPFFSGEM